MSKKKSFGIKVKFGPTPETLEPFYIGSYVPNGPRFIGQLHNPYHKDKEICRFEPEWLYHPKMEFVLNALNEYALKHRKEIETKKFAKP